MAITDLQTLTDALARSISYTVNKSISTSTLSSGWRSNSLPAAGAIPTAAEICTKDTAGAVALVNAPAGMENYLLELSCGTTSTSQASALLADRLMHMGGLSGIITTQQAVNLDPSSSPLDDRRGTLNNSDLEWWLEWYAATGSTATTYNVAMTYTDDTTDTFSWTAGGAPATGRMVQIYPAAGKYIKSIQSVQLSNSSGTAGNFGVTVTRVLAQATPRVMETVTLDWAKTGIQRIPRDACLMVYNYSASGTITNIMFLRIGAA